jgi:dihydropteroate synthase
LKVVKIEHFNEAVDLFNKMGVDPYGIQAMVSKTMAVNIFIPKVLCKVANILKQEMISLGGDAAVARDSVSCSVETTDVLLMGTYKQHERLVEKLAKQPFGLSAVSSNVKQIIDNMQGGNYELKTSRRILPLGKKTIVMGILNVTPDSFSDGNLHFEHQVAIDHGLRMVDEGADIIDVGGESTRPGSKAITSRQEIARVLPVIEGLAAKIKIPISIDTSKAEVASAAIKAGAEIVNDVSALRDKKMLSVLKETQAAIILMHMRGIPENMQSGDLHYDDLMLDISNFLRERCQKAISAGLSRNSIVVDPGIGFGKSYDDNCRIIRKLDELKALGFPILLGTSRKAFIGNVTGGDPQNRLEGTAATVVASILNGCHIVRVHDVAFMRKVADMTDAILHFGCP